MNKLLATCLFLTYYTIAFVQPESIYFAHDPALTPDAQTIIFSYNDDLWSVPVDGGLAKRLTAMDGRESLPSVSPNGKWLAFTSTQYGNEDVFIMPLEGGNIKQLTFHEAYDRVASWTWDSESVYITSNRYNRMSTYTVAVTGGTPTRLYQHYFNNIHNVAQHPNGTIYFNETWESSSYAHRKGYKGPYNPDIKSYNAKNKVFKTHTDYEGKDFDVSIDRRGNVYFVSDEFNGEYNLYTFKKGKKTCLTKFETAIKHPRVSANGDKIVFQKEYQLFVYDVKKGKSKKVPIHIAQNNTLLKSKDFNVSGKISFFDVSDDNKKLCFVSRGELFVSDIKGKFIKQLNTRPDGRVSEAYFLKDNKTIIFNQTVTGYQNWFIIAANGKGKEKQLTNDQQNNRNLSFNSDRTQAVYFSGREEVRLMELDSTYKSSLLVKEELWALYNDLPQFSPQDDYIVFTAYKNFEREIYLVHLESKKKYNLTQTGVTEAAPFFSQDGKYIYFNSNRTRPSYPYGLQNAKIYRMALESFDTPYRSDKFDELFAEKAEKDTTKDEQQATLNIDFDGLMNRVSRVGPRYGSQYNPYVIQNEAKTTILYSSNHDEGTYNIWKTTLEPFEKTKTEKIKGALSRGVAIESTKGKHYILINGNIHQLNLSANKVEKINISHTFRRQLSPEFKQMYYETWANVEENFYDESFHGINWKAKRDQYATFLPYISNRQDLRRLLNDLLGELNTSHFGFNSSGSEEKVYHGSRTLGLGLLFDENNPYTILHIVKRGPADKKDIDLQPGDQLVKINGVDIDPGMNREFYLSQPSIDNEVTLGISRYGKEHEVKLHPRSFYSIRSLLYDEWMHNCQERVDKVGNKRIAYVHMKNMGGGQLQHFKEQMVSEGHNRDGLILDLRYNTGGNVHDEVLRFLSQKPYLNWKYREGALTPQSNFSPAAKPIVVLINEQSLSDAEMTAQGFKELKLGKLIGRPTYRWIIFTSGKSLVDGSYYRLPSWGCYSLDGKNLEKTGVAPDIQVKNTFKDRIQGNDPQLDRAIQEILKELD